MKISPLRVTCQCGQVFDAEIVTDAPISVAVASMQAVRCPKCGSQKCGLGGELPGRPDVSEPLKFRAQWWKTRGEQGTSSLSIYAAYTGANQFDPDIPYDPDDYRRCRLLFDLMPEWRADFTPLVTRYPWYRPYTEHWDEMDRLYDEEAPTGKAPKLYALMKRLEVESHRLRYPKATIETNSDGSLRSMSNPR